MTAGADAEAARIVPLEQVEPAKRAAAAAEAAAPTSTAASRGGKRKGEKGGDGEGWGGLKTPIAPMATRMCSQRSGRVTVAQNYANLSTRGTTNTH